MIFNSFALLFGIYNFSKKTDNPNLISYYLKIIFFIFILFYISVSSVNYIRANYFFVGKQFHDLKFKQKNVNFYENIDELNNDIDKVIIRNCAIFVKGSNSINLKKFIEFVSSKK